MKNYHRDVQYDSHLYMGNMNYTTNADFQLILRVFLRPGPTGVGVVDSIALDGTTHYTHDAVAWGTGELENFRKGYKKLGETAWSNKCWLIPPTSYTELDYPFTLDGPPVPPARGQHRVQCNLRCRLVIELLHDASDAHVIIDAIKFVPKTGQEPRPDAGRLFQTSAADFWTTDVPGRKYLTNTIIHELGHNLGMPHIGVTVGKPLATTPGSAVCTVATQNLAICYDGNTPAQSACRMGDGKNFCASDADPWLNRVEVHTGIAKADWTAKLSRWAPRPRP